MRTVSTLMLRAAAMTLGLGLATAGLAHGSMKPKHGGVVAMSGETLVELVRGPKGVSVYVSEEDEPLASSGMSGKLVITAGAKKREAPLRAAAGNRFDAPGLKLASGNKVAVVLLNKATQARSLVSFTIK